MTAIENLRRLALEIHDDEESTKDECQLATEVLIVLNQKKNQTGSIIIECPDRFKTIQVFNFLYEEFQGLGNENIEIDHITNRILVKKLIVADTFNRIKESFRATPEIIITEI